MKANKKAQVTVFIIIGIVIVVFLGIFYFTKTGLEEERFEPEVLSAERIPTEFSPIKPYVDSCIERIGVEGLKLLGDHGGYIQPEQFQVTSNFGTTSSNGVEFSEGTGYVLPYWFYMKDANDCVGTCNFATEQPPLYRAQGERSIEMQLDAYLDEHLHNCINNFKALRQQYDFSVQKVPKSRTTVTEEGVVFTIDYRFTAKAQEKELQFEGFRVDVPVKLKELYGLASFISDSQAQHKFIEKDVLNLIAGFSSLNEDNLPPYSAIDFSFSNRLTWQESEVFDNLKGILTSYIHLLKVENTHNYKVHDFGDELINTLYNTAMYIPTEQDYSNYDVDFIYLDMWEPYFDINCKGGVCQPESVSIAEIIPLGIQKYNFAYDLSFPVLVQVTQRDALNDEGYSFKYFLEANIRNNEPLGTIFTPLESLQPTPASLLCDENKRNSGTVEVVLRDSLRNTLVEGADVAFTCTGETCLMGKSDAGKLTSAFPVCLGGAVTALHDDYLSSSVLVNTELEIDDTFVLAMHPLLEKTLQLRKKRLMKNPSGWLFQDTPLHLTNKDIATITMSRVQEQGTQEHFVFAEIIGNGKETITLAPGTYEIQITLQTNETLVIPGYERCFDGDDECVDIPRQVLNESYISGGLRMNYTFTAADLAADTITLYVANPDIGLIVPADRRIEDLEQMSKIDAYSLRYHDLLLPTFE